MKLKAFSLSRVLTILGFIIVFIVLLIFITNIIYSAEISITEGFEGSSIGNWQARGGETLSISTEQAHEGVQSLQISTRTKNWEGPQIDLTSQVSNGQKFNISAWVYLDSENPGNTKISAYKNDESGESWTTIASAAEPVSNEWVQIQGEFTLDYTGELSQFTIYVESNFYDESSELSDEEIAALSYDMYIDDISITAAEVSETVISFPYNFDFENNSTDNWQARGSSSISVSDEQSNSGTFSMKVSDRTQSWEGPQIDVTNDVANGQKYYISAWVYTDSEAEEEIKITANAKDSSSEDESWTTVASNNAIPGGTWTRLEGTFDLSYSGELEKLVFYLESPNTEYDFYVDDIKIAGPIVIFNNFDDGNSGSWIAKGSPIVEPSESFAYSGNYSLMVSGRQDSWQGPEYDLSGKLSKGEKYTVSVWVYQDSSEPQNIKITAFNSDSENGDTYTTVASNATVPSGEWTLLQGSYTYDFQGSPVKSTIYLEAPDNTEFDFYIDDVLMTGLINQLKIQEDIPGLFEQYIDDFYIGVAVPSSALSDYPKSDLIKKHFNSITSENEMKPENIHPDEETYSFNASDKYVEYAQANNIRIRYHTLIWHTQVGEWFFVDADGNDVSREVLLDRMKTHIETIVKKYGNSMESWDVVNEALDESQESGLRQSKWQQIIGDDYIEKAFEYARNAATEAGYDIKLFYNDYGLTSPDKLEITMELVNSLKEKGLIDGIGWQGHISLDTAIEKIDYTLSQLSSLGIDVEITELDMKVNPSGTYTVIPETILIKQAYKYKAVMDTILKYKDSITGVTFWGLTDDMSWLNYFQGDKVEAPLLFDQYCQAKHAYWALVEPSKIPVQINDAFSFKGKASIDGKDNEKAWRVAISSDINDSSNNLAGSHKTLWEENTISAFVKVNKSSIPNLESVSFFIDQTNGRDESLQADDISFSIKNDGTLNGEGINGVFTESDNSFLIEVSLPLDAVTLEKNSELGFDIRLTGNDEIISWNDTTNKQDSPSKYGVLICKSPNYINAKEGTIKVDGKIDRKWNKVEEGSCDIITLGDEVATATFKTLWDNEYLYVLAEVQDPVLSDASSDPWSQDSVEFFVDENFARTSSYQEDDGQYRVNFNNVTSFGENGENENFKSAVKIVDGGYIVEAAIPFNTGEIESGKLIGFDVQINDDNNGEGQRTGMRNWSDESTQGYKTTLNYGVLELVSKHSQWSTNPFFNWYQYFLSYFEKLMAF